MTGVTDGILENEERFCLTLESSNSNVDTGSSIACIVIEDLSGKFIAL